ncbi:MAG TPA: mandelate racemase/muconate lactonizing enzyme family protein [Chthoniobacteraceae bacterium]|nr:mandelate racemase/muconate lactonizing enzyme family protein [Chthoniobacteraceae bacterium]
MKLPTDIRVRETALHYIPVKTRVPLKFGAQVVERALCARVRVRVEDANGRSAFGWGETPLSVAWVWPAALSWDERESRMSAFCERLAKELVAFDASGHPMELGDAFQRHRLHELLDEANRGFDESARMPHLAALVCHSLFDLAIFDAFGQLHGRPVFETLGEDLLSADLAHFLDSDARFAGQRPAQYLQPRRDPIPVWHLVGGLDALEARDLTGSEPDDGYPLLLRDWIRADGLRCLKVKLRGNDAAWDYERLVRVGHIAIQEGCEWLSADFNCTVTDPAYVTEILDRLLAGEPRIYQMTLYIEQPFPYDLEAHRIDVRSVSARKPLFLDESAHDWRFVRLGRELGWSGVALKTCKTLTGALLSLCWARAHGMTLMVQDLTNPMLAIIPHVLLASHAGTIMGVECNAMQFYPEASLPEARVHPGLYVRRRGVLDLSTLTGPGFGYHAEKVARELPPTAANFGV